MLQHFDDILWPPLKPLQMPGLAAGAPRIDLAAQLKSMWAK